MATKVVMHRGAERPALEITWYDDDGNLIDLSDATFAFKIGQRGSTATATVTKTTNIVGAATAPNVTVTWTAGELDINHGVYTWQLTATSGNLDRMCEGTFHVLDVIT